MPFRHRSAFAKFRTGAAPLQVNTRAFLKSIFRAQVYEWDGFWKCRTAPPYQNDPLVTLQEVTIDALSQFDAIYMIIPAYTSFLSYFLKTAETPAYLCIIR